MAHPAESPLQRYEHYQIASSGRLHEVEGSEDEKDYFTMFAQRFVSRSQALSMGPLTLVVWIARSKGRPLERDETLHYPYGLISEMKLAALLSTIAASVASTISSPVTSVLT